MYIDGLKLDIISLVKNEQFCHALHGAQYGDFLMISSKKCGAYS